MDHMFVFFQEEEKRIAKPIQARSLFDINVPIYHVLYTERTELKTHPEVKGQESYESN